MEVKEIKLEDLDVSEFIEGKIQEISTAVGDGIAINALSGGVDSSAVTMLAHHALGDRLKTYFLDNGIMRKDEPQKIISLFNGLGVPVERVDAGAEFFEALKGLTDPEEKRQAITDAFYKDVFVRLVKESGATFLLHGTNYTDVEETVAGIKRQHNILEHLNHNTEYLLAGNLTTGSLFLYNRDKIYKVILRERSIKIQYNVLFYKYLV